MAKKFNLIFWIFMGLFLGGVSAVFVFLYFYAKNDIDRKMSVVLLVVWFGFILPLNFLFFYLKARVKRKIALPLLTGIQKQFGGKLILPGMLRPVTMPAIVGHFQNIPFEVTLLTSQGSWVNTVIRQAIESPQARFGEAKLEAKQFLPNWRRWYFKLMVKVGKPLPWTFSIFSQTKISHAVSGLLSGVFKSGMKPLETGQKELDERLCFYSNNPEKAKKALSQDKFLKPIVEGFDLNKPFITKIEVSPSGTIWYGMFTLKISPDTIQKIFSILINTHKVLN